MKQLLFCLILFAYCQSSSAQEQPSSEFSGLDIETLDSLVTIEFVAGDYKGAITYLEILLKKRATSSGTQDSSYGYVINDLGFCNMYAGNYSKAEKLLLQGKRIFTNIYGAEHEEVTYSLSGLAKVYKRIGNYKKAEKVLLEVKRINAKLLGTEHQSYMVALNDLAVLYYRAGRYEEAEQLYLETKKINAKVFGVADKEYSNTLGNLAALYFATQRYEEAELLYLEAIGIAAQVYGKAHPRYALSLNNLAALYLQTKRYSEGEKLCLDAGEIIGKSSGVDHRYYANSLNLLASSYRDQERYEEAIKLYTQAKKIWKKTLGVGHPKYGKSLSYFAGTYFKMGRYQDAITLYLESKEIIEHKLGVQHEDYAYCMNALGRSYFRLDNFPETRFYLTQALKTASGLSMSLVITEAWKDSLAQVDYPSINHIDEALRTLEYLYLLLEKGADPNKASKQLIISKLAHDLFGKIRRLYTNNTGKLRALARTGRWTTRSLRLLDEANQIEEAFDLAEASKSVLLLEATKAEKAYRLGNLPDSLMHQEMRLFKERDDLQANIIQKRPPVERDSLRVLLNTVNQDIHAFVNKLEQGYPNYVNLKYKDDHAILTEIQGLLSPKTALLEYVVTDSVLYLFYIDKKEYKMIRQRIERDQLKTKARALHRALSNYELLSVDEEKAYETYTRPAHWFYKKLIEPIIGNAADIDHLIIVSDGELAHFPFETLLVKPANQGTINYLDLDYLIKHYKISYNYSASLWKENKQSLKPVNNGQILAMAGNYNLELDSLKKDLRLPNYYRNRKGLKPLDAAQREVRILSENFQGYFGFNEGASERLFKEKAADYGVIHLAMHGFLDNKRPILSSLVFTEDGDSVENSFLQAYEISNLKLNADLVVLSACETGFGTFEKGNGIASLARSFMYAGAPSMVVSLWQVNDYVTAKIMKTFYANLSNGMTKSEALQQAKLNFIQNTSEIGQHPAFWSPFVLVGNDEPIQILQKKHTTFWAILVVALLALGIGGLWLWKKRRSVS